MTRLDLDSLDNILSSSKMSLSRLNPSSVGRHSTYGKLGSKPSCSLKDQMKAPADTDMKDQGPYKIQMTDYMKPLWLLNDVEEFKRVFIDGVISHHTAYTTYGILDPDINENTLMMSCPSIPNSNSSTNTDAHSSTSTSTTTSQGIMIDFDIFPIHYPDGRCKPNLNPKPNGDNEYYDRRQLNYHPNCSRVFTAKDRLDVCFDKPHNLFYRYSLESFFYLVMWATIHYRLDRERNGDHRPRVKAMHRWSDEDIYYCYYMKAQMYRFHDGDGLGVYKARMLRGWERVWRDWVIPLYWMVDRGLHGLHYNRIHRQRDVHYPFATCNGHITFERFMRKIGVEVSPAPPGFVE